NTAILTYSIATTSPSHHDCSRQVVLSRLSQFKLTCPLGRPSALSPGWNFARISLVQAGAAALPHLREISTQIPMTHIAMGYDPTIAWKASPTRTPPPIC